MSLVIGIFPSIGGGTGGGADAGGDFILTEDGKILTTENNEPIILE